MGQLRQLRRSNGSFNQDSLSVMILISDHQRVMAKVDIDNVPPDNCLDMLSHTIISMYSYIRLSWTQVRYMCAGVGPCLGSSAGPCVGTTRHQWSSPALPVSTTTTYNPPLSFVTELSSAICCFYRHHYFVVSLSTWTCFFSRVLTRHQWSDTVSTSDMGWKKHSFQGGRF